MIKYSLSALLFFSSLLATELHQQKQHKIIIQISPPRCLSVASLRMWQARGDFIVMNEPFIASFVLINEKDKNPTWWQSDVPPQTFQEVQQKILKMAKNSPIFIKEESYALVDYLRTDPTLIQNSHVYFVFLIRNPHHAISSYYKGHKKIIDNFSYIAGFQQCYEIFQLVQKYGAHKPLIICAEELYMHPYEMAQSLCKALGISFTEQMLHWKDLSDSFTGQEWHEQKNPELTHYWHGAAIHSTEFHKPTSYEVDVHGNPTFSEVKNDADRKVCLQAYYENKVYYDLLLKEKKNLQRKDFMNNFKIKKIIDLSHTLTAENPTWDGSCGFDLPTTLDHHECTSETKYKRHALHLKKAGIGTHIDAPLHCFPDQTPVAQLPLENLIVKACVIDVSSKASPDYVISADDIISFEKLHGTIGENTLVIAYTGWSTYWPDSKKYRNANKDGIMQFPSFSIQAAQLLIDRNVAGIAIDTLSPDCPGSGDPVHRLILSNNKYIIENIANAQLLPPTGAYVIALPLKINATEAPVRIVGLIIED